MLASKKEEYITQMKTLIRLAIVAVFALLYSSGGIEHKWLRRFLAPSWLVWWLFYYTKDWRVFIQLPFMFVTLSLGYGADSFWLKIIRRGIFGIANGVTSSLYYAIRKNFILFATQVNLQLLSYVALGVFNPLVNARAEELSLGLLLGLLPIMGADRRADDVSE